MKAMRPAAPFLVDIAVNLTDCVFRGVDWSGKRIHDDDFELVLDRAERSGVGSIIITGTNLAQCEKAIALCRRYPGRGLYCTVGVHPAHSEEFARPIDEHATSEYVVDDAAVIIPQCDKYLEVSEEEENSRAELRLQRLVELVEANKDVVVAVGEIGVDYAELSCCRREVQEKYFAKQLRTFAPLGLPFLFHSRDCGMRFVDLLKPEIEALPSTCPPVRGVVHSFNGDMTEQQSLLDMGLYLSLNGSAFRTKGLADQVSCIPLNRLMLETDAPWCDIRSKDYAYPFVTTHFDTVKRKKPFVLGKCLERRNEPCHLVQVVEAYLGAARAVANSGGAPAAANTVEEATRALYDNCKTLFNIT